MPLDQVVATDGIKALGVGLGPTVVGYFVQGAFKFGGMEFFKVPRRLLPSVHTLPHHY